MLGSNIPSAGKVLMWLRLFNRSIQGLPPDKIALNLDFNGTSMVENQPDVARSVTIKLKIHIPNWIIDFLLSWQHLHYWHVVLHMSDSKVHSTRS